MPNITVRRRLIKGLIAAAAIPVVALMSKKSLAAPENPSRKPVGSPPSVLTPKGWTWNEPHGFVWGRVTPPSSHTIYVSGQSSVDGAGNILHKGDMGAQLEKSLDNLELILAEAGATLANVVSVTYYTVDIEQFFAAMETLTIRMEKAGCKPTSTLLEVKRLYHPDILFEMASVAVV
ncbi:RidA family protein [Pseudomonas prosekii]|uniref:RidA family protein n=1 Tax=Pseudomonas prosekii TaxID=1148509 RepID=UPI0011EAC59C|nr:RidA family protein [Pseudomonas prosekii]